MITRGDILWLGIAAGVTGSLIGGMMLGIGMDLIVNGQPWAGCCCCPRHRWRPCPAGCCAQAGQPDPFVAAPAGPGRPGDEVQLAAATLSCVLVSKSLAS